LKKLIQLQHKLKENNLDAFLVTNPFNRRYITGFTGTAGVALITESDAFFITDFRYVEQAKEQASHFTIIKLKETVEDELAKLLEKLQINRLGFEQEHVTYGQYMEYKKKFPVSLIASKEMIESLRVIKTEKEIEIIKQAAKIADDSFEYILDHIKPGVREIEIANELEFFMRKNGATSSSFDIIVASGFRSALPHGVASEKEIQQGDLVTLDFGALYKGYCSDITRTVAVGNISEKLIEIYNIVLEAQQRGVQGIKPNMTGKEADALTRDYIEKKGYGAYFGHSTGHGIGLEIHEGPGLSPKSNLVLEKNMVVTVEPGIYIPDLGGCRIEDDIVLTESGNERLTFATKEFIKL